MKSFSALALAAALALSFSVHALDTGVAPKVTSLKNPAPESTLFVGNSFTYYNCGLNNYMRGFTKEENRKWAVRMVTIGGGRLSYHPMAEYLAPHPMDNFDKRTPKFDTVTLQGQSSESIDEKGAANYREYFSKHVKTIREAGAEPIAIITWARQNKPEQTRPLAEAITKAANEENVLAVPVGLAFAESLKVRPDLIMHANDKLHPSAAGSYLYASVLYAALFHKSPEGFKFRGECEKPLKEEDARFLQGLAWKVVKEFYGW